MKRITKERKEKKREWRETFWRREEYLFTGEGRLVDLMTDESLSWLLEINKLKEEDSYEIYEGVHDLWRKSQYMKIDSINWFFNWKSEFYFNYNNYIQVTIV